MIALFASFFSLCVGPLVYQTFGPMRRTDKIVSGVVLVVVSATVVLEVIPQTHKVIGLAAIVICLLGFAGPTIIERSFRKAADTTHKFTIFLGILGLVVHAFLDGVAIQATENSESNSLSLAIIIHRLPVGLTIWWLLKPLLGERYALLTLLVMGISTVFGFFSGEMLNGYHNNSYFAITQALIAGSLLHVVIYKPHADGCMHTNHDHQLHHHSNSSSKTTNTKLLSWEKLVSWENLGILLGIAIFLSIHLSRH